MPWAATTPQESTSKGARDILAEDSEIEAILLTGPTDQLKKGRCRVRPDRPACPLY